MMRVVSKLVLRRDTIRVLTDSHLGAVHAAAARQVCTLPSVEKSSCPPDGIGLPPQMV
jgi:hypothetical protein